MSEEIDTLHLPFIKFLKAQGLLWRRSRPDMKTSETKGEPDFLVLSNGRVLPIEFKDKNSGKLSKDQVFRHAEYARAGCKVHVLRDLGIAIDLVIAWLGQAHDLPAETRGKLRQLYGQTWIETDKGLVKVKSA